MAAGNRGLLKSREKERFQMTRFYLIRHAQAEGNLYQRMHGWYNSGVTQLGERQIAALTGRFDHIQVDAVYSSDLYRCRRTAEAVYLHKGLPLHTHPGLRELKVGIWEDWPFAQVAQEAPGEWQKFLTMDPTYIGAEGGETFAQLQRRVVTALKEIQKAHPQETVAVCTHGMAIRAALAYFHGYGLELSRVPRSENTGVSCVDWDGERATVVYEADVSHLPLEIHSATAEKSVYSGRQMLPLGERCLWFRPWKPEEERSLYYAYRHEAWVDIHGSGVPFYGEQFYQVASKASRNNPESVMLAMLREDIVGIIQMDLQRDAEQGVCFVPFCYMDPEHRHKGMGVQLLGQAVSTARRLGRDKVHLRCAPTNQVAKRFYGRNGFHVLGMAPDSEVALELLEKPVVLTPPLDT